MAQKRLSPGDALAQGRGLRVSGPSNGRLSPGDALAQGRGLRVSGPQGGRVSPGDALNQALGYAPRTPSTNLSKTQDANARATGSKSLWSHITGVAGRVGHDVGSPLMSVLQAIDVPRSVIVTGAAEAGLAARKAVFNDGPGWTNKDFLEGVKHHRGVGQVIQGTEAGASLPLWARRGVGFTGDIAADPLTFLSAGGSKVAEGAGAGGRALEAAGAGERALAGADDAAKALNATKMVRGHVPLDTLIDRISTPAMRSTFGDAAVEDAANKALRRRSIAAIPKEMQDAAGVKTGIQMYGYMVPGTDRIAAKVAGHGSEAFQGAVDKVVSKLSRNEDWAARIGKLEKVPDVHAIRASNIDNPYWQSRQFRESVQAAKAVKATILHDGTAGVRAASKGADGLDHDLIGRIMEEPGSLPPSAFNTPEAAAAKRLSDVLESTRTHVEASTGVKLGTINDYLPHRVSAEYKALLEDSKSGASRSGLSPLEMKRNLDGSVAQIHAEMAARFGDAAIKLFKTDPFEVTQQYVDEAARLVGRRGNVGRLVESGVLKPVPEEVLAAQGARGDAFRTAGQASRSADATLGSVDRLAMKLRAAQADLPGRGAEKAADGGVYRSLADRLAGGGIAAKQSAVDALEAERARVAGGGQVLADASQESLHNIAVDEARKAAPGVARTQGQTVVRSANREVKAAKEAVDALRQDRDMQAVLRKWGTPNLEGPEQALLEKMSAATDRLQQAQDLAVAARTKADVTVVDAAGIPLEMMNPIHVTGDLVDGRLFVRPRPNLDGLGLPASTTRRLNAVWDAHRLVVGAADTAGGMDVAFGTVPEAIAANKARLAELDSQIADAKGLLKAGVKSEQSFRAQADRLFAAADKEQNRGAELIARLEGQSALAEAKYAGKRETRIALQAVAADTAQTAAIADQWFNGMRELTIREGLWADDEVAKAVDRLAEYATPKKVGVILKTVDTTMSRWRAYALLSPGYHIRNELGGVMNNAVAGVETGTYRRWGKAWREAMAPGVEAARADGLHKWSTGWGDKVYESFDVNRISDPEMRRAVDSYLRSDAGSGVARDMSDVSQRGAAQGGVVNAARRARGLEPSKLADIADPTSLSFRPLQLNFDSATRVENHLRGVMFADTVLNKQGTVEEAVRLVKKFHFDYSELSEAEREGAKRIFAFYTWNRKNFPLQIEMMVRRPGVFAAYTHAKANLELGTPNEQVVPSYYGRLLAIHTPWKDPAITPGAEKGANLYLTPDLPFIALQDSLSTSQLGASLNPFIKTPIEAHFGKQFFSGSQLDNKRLTPVPKSWLPIAPILYAAHGFAGIPKVQIVKGPDGHRTFAMTQMDGYKVEQAMPLLGRLRRIAPSEPRYQSRAMSSWMSFFMGASVRTNSQSAQNAELASRSAQVTDLINRYYAEHPALTKPGSAKAKAAARAKLAGDGWNG